MALAIALAGATVVPVGAHGSDGDGPVWSEREIGPYVVTFWADLHVPATSVYARVHLADGSPAPEGTRMTLLGTGPDAATAEAEAVRVAGRAGQAGDFAALLPVPREGEWSVAIQLSGPAGAGEDVFERTARPESAEQWSRAPFLWATLLIVIIAAGGAWRRKIAGSDRRDSA